MNSKRPINLNLFAFKFPLTAIVSILHRISGFFLFLCIPAFLYVLDLSLASDEGFSQVLQLLNNIWVKLIVWIMVSALIYHLVAGIRHIFMDFGVAESLHGAKIAAWLTMILSAGLIALFGVWLWSPM